MVPAFVKTFSDNNRFMLANLMTTAIIAAMDETKDKKISNVVVQEIKERLNDQMASLNRLDTKAAITLSFVGALIAGLASSEWFVIRDVFYKCIVLVPLVLSAAAALVAILVRSYNRDPLPRPFYQKYRYLSDEVINAQLVINWVACFEKNQPKAARKALLTNISFTFLAVAILLLCIAIIFSDTTIVINPLE